MHCTALLERLQRCVMFDWFGNVLCSYDYKRSLLPSAAISHHVGSPLD